MIMCGSEEHVIDAAVTHAITAHGHEDTPELREWTRKAMKPESAALEQRSFAARRRVSAGRRSAGVEKSEKRSEAAAGVSRPPLRF